MLNLGAINAPTRRSILTLGACAALGLSWRHMAKGLYTPLGTAKRVVLLWLWGGPSQLDTFDPKPMAPEAIRGPFGTIQTRITGIRYSELFPRLAERNDQFALVRSMRTHSNDHGVAGTIGLTGSIGGAVGLNGIAQAGSTRPALGSTVARALPARGQLPPFLVLGGKLHQGKKAIIGEGGGPLGPAYNPFRINYGLDEGISLPDLELNPALKPERLAYRDGLRSAIDRVAAQADSQSLGLDAHRARALALLTGPSALKAFDLASERPQTRAAYGHTRFGQACLLARRLVERDVPFVQVNWSDHVEAEEDAGDGGWDHHYRNFTLMADRHAPWLDRAVSALLDDLAGRGLLDSTLVIAMGEFGRAPKINDKAGRDHWEHCYTALLAGGGVRGGTVLGSSDATASFPVDHAATPVDLAATVHAALGLTSESLVNLGIGTSGRVMDELF